ncbi:MAG: hypothetical protein K1X57_07665 [Gemmataceae bacterium]|nr:hypothetical protein [Gemmataceae bacterium]
MSYLAAAAEKYGVVSGDQAIGEFFRMASSDELNALSMLSWRVADDFDDIDAWLDRYPMTHHKESALVYFALHLVAIGNDCGVLTARPRNRESNETDW